MSKLFAEKYHCTGCHSCYNVCPVQAISMQPDAEGFLYPMVDQEKCVDCHLCEQVCPIDKERYTTDKLPQAYAGICNSEDVRMQSSSGGVFTLLAEHILQMGGAVFGAVQTCNGKAVEHRVAWEVQEQAAQRGSKYVQSRIGNSYKQAENILKQGIPVLFTGTPCQIAGLYAYLRKDYENLYTQDLICHGAPSPLVWEKYAREVEDEAGQPIKAVYFRNKERGWKNFSLRMEFQEKEAHSQGLFEDLYLKGFMSDMFLRPSCYQCRYKSMNRQADITLADYWGVENVFPELDDDQGISLVLIHTPKGEKLLHAIRNNMTLLDTDTEQAVQYNPAMIKSAKCPDRRGEFWRKIQSHSYRKLAAKLFRPPWQIRMRQAISRVVKRNLRR